MAILAIALILPSTAVYADMQQKAANEAKVHREQTIKAAGIICLGPELPVEEISYTKSSLERAQNVTHILADAYTVIDNGESERVKTLQLAAKQLSKAERRVDNYFYLAREWNMYWNLACRTERYPTDDNIEAFSNRTSEMPIKIVARTSPTYGLLYQDDIVPKLLELTPPEALPAVNDFLTRYSYYGFAVEQFEEKLEQAQELARQHDAWLQFLEGLEGAFLTGS